MANRLYIRDFPETFTVDQLKSKFLPFGPIKKAYIVSADNKRHAVLRYYNPENCKKAIRAYHKNESDGVTLYVAICEKGEYRKQRILTAKQHLEWLQYQRTIFVREFPETWTDDDLKEAFAKYGKIESAKIDGKRAFVSFAEESFSKEAVADRERLVEGKRLYVRILIPKEKLARYFQNKKAKKNSGEEKILETPVETKSQYRCVSW